MGRGEGGFKFKVPGSKSSTRGRNAAPERCEHRRREPPGMEPRPRPPPAHQSACEAAAI